MLLNFRIIFNTFISTLSDNNVRYCILRGYEGLPDSFSNDIDFGIHPKDKKLFFNALRLYKDKTNAKILYRDSRFEVLKISVLINYSSFDFDFWFGINYVGLEYMNIKTMIENYSIYNKMRVLNNENEITLSFLKELLHNNKLRHDKVEILNSKLSSSDYKYIATFFSHSLKNEMINSIIKRQFRLNKLAYKAKLQLFVYNSSPKRILSFIYNFLRFSIYRFFPSTNPLVINIRKF